MFIFKFTGPVPLVVGLGLVVVVAFAVNVALYAVLGFVAASMLNASMLVSHTVLWYQATLACMLLSELGRWLFPSR